MTLTLSTRNIAVHTNETRCLDLYLNTDNVSHSHDSRLKTADCEHLHKNPSNQILFYSCRRADYSRNHCYQQNTFNNKDKLTKRTPVIEDHLIHFNRIDGLVSVLLEAAQE